MNIGTALVLGVAMIMAGCKKDDPVPPTPGGNNPPPNEQELITTVVLHFESQDGTEHRQFVWRDLDGDGGDAPVIEVEPLTAGQVYSVHVQLLDESKDPPVDITHEVEQEAEEHQFFYIVDGVGASFVYADADANGHPVGIGTIWTMGAAGSGTLTVVLRHEPDKDAPGASAGDITNAGGDTDVEVTFPLIIQ
ncbi:MAG: type 1 periplasmic binding fold superfamily protein [Flavobacteriales bacterium]|nr:type 1 periplasmic binding fold superfamily protein [Flavobacteriales bacterium]